MKVGIYGGTFDPVHLAHLRLAEEVRECCGLDQVVFTPAARPPHKDISTAAPFSDRLAMLQLAVANNDAFSVSDIERHRPGKNYTVDLLVHLQEGNPDNDYYFILGLDSLVNITSWYSWQRLFGLTHLVVVNRPGVVGEKKLDKLLPVAIRNQFCYTPEPCVLRHESGNTVVFLKETCLGISSTQIRKYITADESVRYLLPEGVDTYIRCNDLYRQN